MSDPVSANASWFAALKGVVSSEPVRRTTLLCDLRALPAPLTAEDASYLELGFTNFPAPEDAKVGERYWLARAEAARGVHGVGKTPADAIAAFNYAMVTP